MRREITGAAAQWSGVGRFFEAITAPTGALVLMYHSINDGDASRFIDPANGLSVDLFERQMAFLGKHRKVVSLSELVTQIRAGTVPSKDTVCITFDDGYLDNLTVAAPILKRHGFAATLYLATGYISRAESQWSDVLHSSVARRTRPQLKLALPGVQDVNLGAPAERDAALRVVRSHLLESTYEVRSAVLSELMRQLAPDGDMPRLTMNWDDARRLRDEYPLFEFGGHTRNHIDLRTQPVGIATTEIEGCSHDIRRELGIAPRHFSFPYGRWNARSREVVIGAGWSSAMGSGFDLRIGPNSDTFALPRIDAPRFMTDFRFKTSGAHPGLFSALGWR